MASSERCERRRASARASGQSSPRATSTVPRLDATISTLVRAGRARADLRARLAAVGSLRARVRLEAITAIRAASLPAQHKSTGHAASHTSDAASHTSTGRAAVCLLEPSDDEIRFDEAEIADARWLPLHEYHAACCATSERQG
eukprot:1841565-Prymnesium_polylepis.2